VQRIEVGDAIHAKHHDLAIDHELLESILQRRFDDPRIAVGPIIATSGGRRRARPAGDSRHISLRVASPGVGDAGRFGGQTEFEGHGGQDRQPPQGKLFFAFRQLSALAKPDYALFGLIPAPIFPSRSQSK
jgi:hypothetical protein